jgi:SAM-dependent methyltransferase
MESQEYKNIFLNEKSHFYYKGLRELLIEIAKKVSTGVKYDRILDAGCGTGLLTTELSKLGKTWSVDASKEAVKFCKLRSLKTRVAKVEKLPFPSNFFSLITCIDVLVSVDSDARALNELRRVCKKNGHLIVRVSAHEWLRTGHDKVVHIKRRYELEDIKRKISKSGFTIEKISYMNCYLLPPLVMKKLLGRGAVVSNIGHVNRILNFLLSIVSKTENKWLMKHGLPEGIGIIVVARKS